MSKVKKDNKPKNKHKVQFEKKVDNNDNVVLYGRHPVIFSLKAKKRTFKDLFISSAAWNFFVSQAQKEGIEFSKNCQINIVGKENIKSFKNIDIHDRVRVINTLPRFVIEEVGDGLTQGVVAIASKSATLNFDAFIKRLEEQKSELPRVLILDQLSDPRNIGALIRSAVAFGFEHIIVDDKVSPKETSVILKTSAGMLDMANIIRVGNINNAIKELKQAGYWVAGLAGEGTTPLSSISSSDIAVVMGNEGDGLRELVKKNCDVLARIEMAEGVESLNVSVAGAIAMYEISKEK